MDMWPLQSAHVHGLDAVPGKYQQQITSIRFMSLPLRTRFSQQLSIMNNTNRDTYYYTTPPNIINISVPVDHKSELLHSHS